MVERLPCECLFFHGERPDLSRPQKRNQFIRRCLLPLDVPILIVIIVIAIPDQIAIIVIARHF